MAEQPDRLALLIGVVGCGDARLFTDLPSEVIRQDIARMRDALAASGYEIEILGLAPEDPGPEVVIEGEASRGRCISAIRSACGRVREGGTLVIYFSGHGVRAEGRDYLVPSDASGAITGDRADPDSLLDLDISRHVGHCSAALVALIVDACREDRTTTIDIQQLQGLPRLPGGVFSLVMGCGPGEVCGYDTRGSFFTRELAQCLSVRTSVRTLTEIVAAVSGRLRAVGQSPRLEHSTPHGAERLDLPICDSISMFDEWRAAVENSPLWPAGDHTSLISAAVEHVSSCADNVHRMTSDVQGALEIHDPWADNSYPLRVLDRMADLCVSTSDGSSLTAIEATLATLAVFIREEILALGMFDLHSLDIRDVTANFQPGLRADLEAVYATYDHLCRRAAHSKDKPYECDALVMWMVYVWLLDREDVWERPDTRARCRAAADSVLRAIGTPYGDTEIDDYAEALRALARSAGSAVDPTSLTDLSHVDHHHRLVPLGRVLPLAAVLGVDTRHLPEVVAEHIGLRDPVPLQELRDIAARVRWVRDGDHLQLAATCPHPAIHVALAELVERAEYLRRWLAELGPVEYPGIPESIRAIRLRPANSPDRGPAYQEPLLRFRVAADRVQRLLMGTQLYGKPQDAIRELYQNALDACRYRETRLRYAYHDAPQDIPWAGRIRMRTNTDERWLECEDNGVGMSQDILTTAFSEAGSRFVHAIEFRREQARWQQVDPELRLYPNSQFGIGVLSYFMLAEEITLWTVPTDHRGRPTSTAYEVSIGGGGGIFRIRATDAVPAGIRGGGTLVRLHLGKRPPENLPELLTEYVWYSEFDVEVNGVPTLMSDQLKRLGRTTETLRVNQEVWWVSGDGGYLADGILAAPKSSRLFRMFDLPASSHNKPFGYVVNLAGRRRPTLNVSRTEILEWDQAWINSQLRAAIGTLPSWPEFTLKWLWKVQGENALLARQISQDLAELSIPVGLDDSGMSVRLGAVGCWPIDEKEVFVRQPRQPQPSFNFAGTTLEVDLPWLLPWRTRCWQLAGIPTSSPMSADLPLPDRVDGYPPPTLGTKVPERVPNPASFFRHATREQDDSQKEDASRTIAVWRAFAIAGVDLRAVRWAINTPSGHVTAAKFILDMFSRYSGDGARLAGLVKLSESLGHDIHSLWLEALEYVPMDAIPGSHSTGFDTSSLDQYVADEHDLALLIKLFDDESSQREVIASASWQRIIQASQEFQLPPAEVAARYSRFIPLGFWCAAPADWTGVDQLNLSDPVEKFIFELERHPTVVDLIDLAIALNEPVSDVRARVSDLTKMAGLAIDVPDVAHTFDGAAETDVWRLLRGIREQPDEAGVLLRFVENIHGLLTTHVTTGIGAAVDVAADVCLPSEASVTLPMLIQMSGRSRLSMLRIRDILTVWLGDRLRLDEISDLDHVAGADFAMHTDLTVNTSGQWERPTAFALLERSRSRGLTVGRLVQQYEVYRPLGANLPEVAAELHSYSPDAHDQAMCEENVGLNRTPVPLPDDIVTPLHLIRVAGRFGWDLRATYDRFERLVSLGLTMTMERDSVPEGLVYWPDLIVLTTELDGWEPALSGTVRPEHVARAAAAVDESDARCRERITRYAQLFGLELSDADQ